MTLFESLLVILLLATILLQLSRQFSLPYPSMLAAAGIVIALIPAAPYISINPATSLALFIAPAVVDAAYDFPLGAVRRFRAPLVAYAIFAVILTSIVVGLLAKSLLNMPLAAGIVLGAIVAPPDATAAAAILRNFRLPSRTDAVLKGESLFNDATALLLFSGGLLVFEGGGLTLPVGLRLIFAPPGGVLLGILCAYAARRANRSLRDTLGGTLFQFVTAYLVWVLAQHLRLSAVLCEIAFAMTLARTANDRDVDARMRVQSYAVWNSVVFTLNVVAFLLMGMQARSIVLRMPGAHLREAFVFSALISLAVICTRLLIVFSFTRLERWWQTGRDCYPLATPAEAFFVGWCGMRGFVTIATAFALPAEFPHRDTAVLTAFSVVVVTLILQGLTVAPLLKVLKLDRKEELIQEAIAARVALTRAAIASLDGQEGPEVENFRYRFLLKLHTFRKSRDNSPLDRLRALGLKAVAAERAALENLRTEDKIDPPTYLDLQEQLDWQELAISRDGDRRIEEI